MKSIIMKGNVRERTHRNGLLSEDIHMVDQLFTDVNRN